MPAPYTEAQHAIAREMAGDPHRPPDVGGQLAIAKATLAVAFEIRRLTEILASGSVAGEDRGHDT